jgi:DNA-binding MarR family transcriptional regulator
MKEWLTQKEIAEMLGIETKKLYPTIATLRRTGQIQTTPAPGDELVILVHHSALPLIRRALNLDAETGTA